MRGILFPCLFEYLTASPIDIFMKTIFLFVSCFFLVASVYAQQQLSIPNGCSYTGEGFKKQLYAFSSDKDAEATLARLIQYTGLPANFIIRAADVPNAQASILGTQRYIFYNQYFLARLKDAVKNDWAATSIMAHEIGHHLSGHTLDNEGSRPTKELEADRFSGFVLAKMGAKLEETLAAMQMIASELPTVTHPAKPSRIAAITNGWQAAKDLERTDTKSNVEKKDSKAKEVEEALKKANIITSRINQVWAEHNVTQDGRIGMRIHTSFDVSNMDKVQGLAVAYFYLKDGTPLKDFNGLFTSVTGQATSSIAFTPAYPSTNYSDLNFFMPYDELHMNAGRYDLKFKVELFRKKEDGNYENLKTSDWVYFWHSK